MAPISRKFFVAASAITAGIGLVIFAYLGLPEIYTLTDILGHENLDNVDGSAFPWNASNRLGLKIYEYLETDANMAFSPIGVFLSASSAYEGAVGNTALELENALGIVHNETVRHDALMSAIATQKERNPKYDVGFTNALRISDEFTPYDAYVDTLSAYYDSSVEYSDEEQVILSSTVRFNATWESDFSGYFNQPEPFWITFYDQRSAITMTQFGQFNHTRIDGVKIIKMPYQGDRYSMLVILPVNRWDIDAAYDVLAKRGPFELVQRMHPKEMMVQIPKFEINTCYNLVPFLQNLGVNDAFDTTNADFSTLTPSQLSISAVDHFVSVAVHGAGTDDSSIDVMAYLSVDANYDFNGEKFIANHPFIFVIWDEKTKSILIMGKVNHPYSSQYPETCSQLP